MTSKTTVDVAGVVAEDEGLAAAVVVVVVDDGLVVEVDFWPPQEAIVVIATNAATPNVSCLSNPVTAGM